MRPLSQLNNYKSPISPRSSKTQKTQNLKKVIDRIWWRTLLKRRTETIVFIKAIASKQEICRKKIKNIQAIAANPDKPFKYVNKRTGRWEVKVADKSVTSLLQRYLNQFQAEHKNLLALNRQYNKQVQITDQLLMTIHLQILSTPDN